MNRLSTIRSNKKAPVRGTDMLAQLLDICILGLVAGFEREGADMNNQAPVIDDLDRFRNLLHILAAGLVVDPAMSANSAAGMAAARAR